MNIEKEREEEARVHAIRERIRGIPRELRFAVALDCLEEVFPLIPDLPTPVKGWIEYLRSIRKDPASADPSKLQEILDYGDDRRSELLASFYGCLRAVARLRARELDRERYRQVLMSRDEALHHALQVAEEDVFRACLAAYNSSTSVKEYVEEHGGRPQ